MSFLWIIGHMLGLAYCIAGSKSKHIAWCIMAGHLLKSQIVMGVCVRPAEAHMPTRVTAMVLQEEAVRGCRQE